MVIAAAAMKSVSEGPSATEKCDKRKYDVAVHSRFVGQELDLICNHNFG